jgi:hypothetical protein
MTMGSIHEFAHRVEQGDRVIAVSPQKQPQTQSGGFLGAMPIVGPGASSACQRTGSRVHLRLFFEISVHLMAKNSFSHEISDINFRISGKLQLKI